MSIWTKQKQIHRCTEMRYVYQRRKLGGVDKLVVWVLTCVHYCIHKIDEQQGPIIV